MPHTPSATVWDIVVVGGANTDFLVRGPHLPRPGETIMGARFQQAPGGKGANQAVAAARLGARVALIARVGADDRAKDLLKALKQEAVHTGYVQRSSRLDTGVALVMVAESGEKQIMVAAGANGALSPADIRAAAEAIQHARVLLLAAEVPQQALLAAARLARQAGAQVVLDPARPAALPQALLKRVDVVKPNASEAEALSGVRVRGRASARRAARKLLAQGVGAVAVQAGQKGNLLVWPEGEHWLPLIDVPHVDATGAGDAFAAALAVSLAEGKSWPAAGALASAAAALKTTVLGAQAGLPRRQAVEALLQRAREAGEAWALEKNASSGPGRSGHTRR
jgi:ribokinase